MDPRDLLRRYLEQRRELGETELLLDGMSVEEVMRIVGAAGAGGAGSAASPAANRREASAATADSAPPGEAGGWREALRAAGAAPADTRSASVDANTEPRRDQPVKPRTPGRYELVTPAETTPSASHEPAPRLPPPTGIIVGSATRDLFAGPGPKLRSLDEIAATVAKCTLCPLHKSATNPVPGEGSANAELVCVGEAPGANEDATGRPFVGQAGQLLTKILAAINLRREDVFICNVLKHRPPENRSPAPEEISACRPYLAEQLDVIRPKVIIAFGTFAAQTLLDTRLGIGKLREQVHRYYGVPLIVTYHPAALLRNPAWKRPTWEDVQLARRILDDAQRV